MVNIDSERGIGFLHVFEIAALVLQSDIAPNPIQQPIYRLADSAASIRSESHERSFQVSGL